MTKYQVVVTSPVWSLNGVNIFAANLVRGLLGIGVPSHLLITHPDSYDNKPMPVPDDIPVTKWQLDSNASWFTRWTALDRYLKERKPCIYIPNYDFGHSCAAPMFSHDIGVVGIAHSDDPQHYEHVEREGVNWSAIVAVSNAISDNIASRFPWCVPRLSVIPYGVPIDADPPSTRGMPDELLQMAYSGRIVKEQKRIEDLAGICGQLTERGISYCLHIIGSGYATSDLKNLMSRYIEAGSVKFHGTLPNQQVLSILRSVDVFLLTSEFEGMPLSLLEAMGCGCIPVVSDIRSGIPEVVRDGENGFVLPIGDISGFADRLAQLQADLNLRRKLSLSSYETVRAGDFSIEDMAVKYNHLFRNILEGGFRNRFRRKRWFIVPPQELRPKWTCYLSLSKQAKAQKRIKSLRAKRDKLLGKISSN